MTYDRFVWQRGDITLSKPDKPLTDGEKQRAKKRLQEIMENFDDKKTQD